MIKLLLYQPHPFHSLPASLVVGSAHIIHSLLCHCCSNCLCWSLCFPGLLRPSPPHVWSLHYILLNLLLLFVLIRLWISLFESFGTKYSFNTKRCCIYWVYYSLDSFISCPRCFFHFARQPPPSPVAERLPNPHHPGQLHCCHAPSSSKSCLICSLAFQSCYLIVSIDQVLCLQSGDRSKLLTPSTSTWFGCWCPPESGLWLFKLRTVALNRT